VDPARFANASESEVFRQIADPSNVEAILKQRAGIVATGLFIQMAGIALIGDDTNNVLSGFGTQDNGTDILTGNGGADTFVFSGGRVTITDFSHSGGDLIDLSFLNFGAGITATELQAIISAAPDANTLDFGNGQVVAVANVNVNTLQTSDFILHH